MMGEKKNDFRTISGSIENHMESNIAHSIVSALCECGLKPDEIGIIAPYTSQVKLLKKKMSLIPLLEINTINQYQGRDKEVIIYSCTRSGRSPITEKASCLLNDFRRLTVAVTRAKYKLIIVGDKETLHHYAPFNKLFLNLAKSQCFHLCPGKDKFL
jgi:DNA replication ATP-dependent helicase Dna2